MNRYNHITGRDLEAAPFIGCDTVHREGSLPPLLGIYEQVFKADSGSISAKRLLGYLGIIQELVETLEL